MISREAVKQLLRLWWLRLLRTWKLVLAVSLGATVAAAVCYELDLFGIRDAELDAYDDGLTAMTGPIGQVEKSKDIIILAIDDLTLQAVAKNPGYALNYGSWPYSRNVWARVIEHLGSDGARAVVFDAVMDERHPDPTGDLAIGEAVKEAKVPFYVGFNISQSRSTQAPPKIAPKNRRGPTRPVKVEEQPPPDENQGDEEFPDEGGEEFPNDEFPEGPAEGERPADDGYPKATPEEIAGALAFPVGVTGLSLPTLADADGVMRYPQPPIAPLIPSTAGFGLVVMEEDSDGKLRRTRFAYTDGINTYVTLPTAVAADLFEADEVKIAPKRLQIGDVVIPINADGSAEIDYGGDLDQRFQTLSLIHVLDDWTYDSLAKSDPDKIKDLKRKLAPGYFKDKVVVIGGFALGTADVKGTPFSASTPGVVKQASEIQNLLDHRFITEAPFWSSVMITFLVAAFSMMIIVVFRSSVLDVAWPLLLFFGFFLVTGWLLVGFKIHVLSALPSYAASFTSAVGALFNHFFAAQDRDRLREAFSGSVASILLEQLVEERSIPRLAGENREVTALVTDINDFSALTERYAHDPAGLQRLLNRYYTALTDVVLEHGGYVNKYIGDSIICLFGAPLNHPDHPLRACEAAQAIIARAHALESDLPELAEHQTRVGVSTAEMFIGNFGSDQRVDYTAVGDEMRIAARIERENENLGTQILISQRTAELAGSRVEVRSAAEVVLLEGDPPQTVYELVDVR